MEFIRYILHRSWVVGKFGRIAIRTVALFICITAFLPVTTFAAPAGPGQAPYPATPEGVVEALTNELYEGKGLYSTTWRSVEKYVVPEVEFSGGDWLRIVRKYDGTCAGRGDAGVICTVNYELIGDIDGRNNFTPKKGTEKVTYRLIKVGGLWKASNLAGFAHISIKAAVGYLEPHSNEKLPWPSVETLRILKRMTSERR